MVGCKDKLKDFPKPVEHEHAKDTCVCYFSQFGKKVNGSYPWHVMQDALNYSNAHGGGMICDTDALSKRDDSLNKEIYSPLADALYKYGEGHVNDTLDTLFKSHWNADGIYSDSLGHRIRLDSLEVESISPPFNKWYNHNIQPIDSLHLKTNINHE